MRQILLVLSLSVFLVATCFAQRDMPRSLRDAVDLLESEEAQQALELAEEFLAQEPAGKHTTVAMLLAGRCEVRLGLGREAVTRAQLILDRITDGNELKPQAWYLLATAHQVRGDYYESARALVRCLDSGAKGEIQEYSLHHLAELIKGPVAYKASTLKLLATRESTKNVLDIILPSSAEKPLIGVLIPEVESENDPGTALLEGVEAAMDRWKSLTGEDVDLAIKRVPTGSAHAVYETRNMIRDLGVWGLIVGGKESDVIAASVEAQSANVPIVLPGQRRPNLNAVGPTVVLPEANWRREGEIAAHYAVDSLGLGTIGIVAPFTNMGKEIVEGFLSIIEERDSVEILAQEWYFPEEGVSLSRQFQRIRTVGFRRDFLDSLRFTQELVYPDTIKATLDTLVLEDKLILLDSLGIDTGFVNSRIFLDSLELAADSTSDSIRIVLLDSMLARRDSIKFERFWEAANDSIQRTIAYKTGQVDSNDIEMKSYDGLYLLIEPETIQLFAPQFAFYSFNTTRIGNAAWYNPDLVYRNRQYVEELILTTPYFLTGNSGEMGELLLYLHKRTGKAPNEWHIRGYDAANILLEAKGEENENKEDMTQGISLLDSLDLASIQQSFEGMDIVGKYMRLLTIRNGEIIPEDIELRREMLAPPVEFDSLNTIDSLSTPVMETIE